MARLPGKGALVLVLSATVVQLTVASLANNLSQFAGKGFAARLALYPVLMLLVPAAWWARHRRRPAPAPAPWAGFTLVMTPFLVDVTGNTLNLYDTVSWWDDANHFVNWFLLCLGLGLVLDVRSLRPGWAKGVVVIGGGALLALIWEIGEYWAFIRNSTELATAYRDTLGDMTLGTCGAGFALLVLQRHKGTSGPGNGDPPAEPMAKQLHPAPERPTS